MSNSPALVDRVVLASRLIDLLCESGQPEVPLATAERFGAYVSLLLKWNARMNLTAVRDAEGILRRHVIESIACANGLPPAIVDLLDLGSGAGFPGIPIALCRTEISVTLAESQAKKAAFLQEAVRTTGIEAKVYAGRAEELGQQFDCIALRAVDKMTEAVRTASTLVRPSGTLALLTTQSDQDRFKGVAGAGFTWAEPLLLPGGSKRSLLLGRRDA